MRFPDPLRALRSARPRQARSKITTVAVAHKLIYLAWQLLTKQQDYHNERPALTHRKLRQLELAASARKRSNPHGHNARATPHTPTQWKAERVRALRIEEDYRTAVAK